MQFVCVSLTVVSTIKATYSWNKVGDKKNKKDKNKNKYEEKFFEKKALSGDAERSTETSW